VQHMSQTVATDQSVHFGSALLPDGWASDVRIVIRGGSIAAVERDVPPQSADERASVGLPGMPNVHSHAFQRAMAGLTEQRGAGADSFWTWRELIYRIVARIAPDDLEAFTAQAYMEMLEAGFTRVGEFHYLHHDPQGRPYADSAETAGRVVAAAEQCGIALTLLPVFYAHGGFGGQPPTEGQRRFVNDVDRFARVVESSRKLVASIQHGVVGIAPHSLRAVTPDELLAIEPLACGGPIHIHAAEQLREVEDCVAWSGMRPVEWLLRSVAVSDKWCLVHATHINESETARLAASGAIAGLCPITEANLGDGVFPATAFQSGGGRYAIGTDSNVLISVGQELRQLEYTQRLRDRMRNVLGVGLNGSTGRTLYERAVQGGGQALGVHAGIEPGAPADLVSLATDAVIFAGRNGDQLLDTFVFAGGDRCVDSVWRAGLRVVENGRHRHRAGIEQRYRAALERLLRA
jgi:formimidoylglutamate deiminase